MFILSEGNHVNDWPKSFDHYREVIMALSLASSRANLAVVLQFRVVLRQFSNIGIPANPLRCSGQGQGCSKRLLFFSSRQFSRCSEVRKAEAKPDTGPVKFTESRAYQLGPQIMQAQKKEPWFQLPIILTSMASMLIYFCVLRYYCSFG